MTYLTSDIEVCRKGTTIVFSQTLRFRIEKLQFHMHEEVVDQENLKTPR